MKDQDVLTPGDLKAVSAKNKKAPPVVESHDVKAWGKTVCIRKWSLDRRMAVQDATAGRGSAVANAIAVAGSVCNDKGHYFYRRVSEGHADINHMDPAGTLFLAEKIARLNNLTEESREELEKNSGGGETSSPDTP